MFFICYVFLQDKDEGKMQASRKTACMTQNRLRTDHQSSARHTQSSLSNQLLCIVFIIVFFYYYYSAQSFRSLGLTPQGCTMQAFYSHMHLKIDCESRKNKRSSVVPAVYACCKRDRAPDGNMPATSLTKSQRWWSTFIAVVAIVVAVDSNCVMNCSYSYNYRLQFQYGVLAYRY